MSDVYPLHDSTPVAVSLPSGPYPHTIKYLPRLAGLAFALRVTVAVPSVSGETLAVDTFIMHSDQPFRWPLAAMQYVMLGERIAQFINAELDDVKVIGVDPIDQGHASLGETDNTLEIPPRFFEFGGPISEPVQR